MEWTAKLLPPPSASVHTTAASPASLIAACGSPGSAGPPPLVGPRRRPPRLVRTALVEQLPCRRRKARRGASDRRRDLRSAVRVPVRDNSPPGPVPRQPRRAVERVGQIGERSARREARRGRGSPRLEDLVRA